MSVAYWEITKELYSSEYVVKKYQVVMLENNTPGLLDTGIRFHGSDLSELRDLIEKNEVIRIPKESLRFVPENLIEVWITRPPEHLLDQLKKDLATHASSIPNNKTSVS